MASCSGTTKNSNPWASAQLHKHLPSSSKHDNMGFISTKKPTRIAKIKCALHSPSFIHFPNQSTITKTDSNTRPPQTQPAPTKWNFIQKAAAMALDLVEGVVISHETQNPLPKTVDPRVQIAGNFAPVPEQPVRHNLPVFGTIPACINGVYVRNGANPLHEPVSGHHLFDGDGMVHAVSISGNSASYSCRFTETHRLVQERDLGRHIFPKAIGELHGHSGIARLLLFYTRGLLGLIDHNNGIGVANAGLIYFNNRLLAMSEDDLPYHIRISPTGDIKTVGRYDFSNQLQSPMIAHPKLDPVTGELFALSYDVVRKPYLKYFKVSKDGEKSPDVEIPLEIPTMIHDFAITENFVVIPDHQLVFKFEEMIKGGSPVIYDEKKKSRFGIMSKNADQNSKESIIWVECPDTFCFHLWNAWEEPESDEVVVIGSCMTPVDSIFNECDDNLKSVLSEIRLNVKTGECKRRAIIRHDHHQLNLEAGMVNKNKLGRRTKFAYLAIAEPWPKVSGFAKVDLSTGEVEKFMYGHERYGGEPYFLPKISDSNSEEREDDGYVMAFVHDEKTWKSELQIINAGDLKLEATVKLPTRVPYGFHGTFINSNDLAQQQV